MEEVVKIVIEELANRGFIHTTGMSYKNTEVLLYNIPKMQESIKDRKEEIKELKSNGLKKKSKSITSFMTNAGSINKEDEEVLIGQAIDNLNKEIYKSELSIAHIKRAISKFSEDKYYDIITYKYLDGKTLDEIVDIYAKKGINVDMSTISRNKNRLINELRMILYPNEFWLELCNNNAKDTKTKKK